MTELSLLVNLSGAALFALVGMMVLGLSRGHARGVLVGTAAASFGLAWVFENLWRMTAFGSLAFTGLVAFSGLAAVACVALTVHLVRPLPRTARVGVLIIGMLAGVLWVAFAAIGFSIVYAAFVLSLTLLTGAIAVAAREAADESGALPCLGLAFAPFVTFLHAAFAGSAGFNVANYGTGRGLLFLASGMLVAMAIVPFGRRPAAGGLWSRAVFPVAVASGLAGLVLVVVEAPTFSQGYGSFGIIRTGGAFFLALAVLRYDLLGVPLPRIAVRRGTLATGALAILFVVAEVAQNFLSARFGLLLGGVIAGTLLFAANPVQRAMERLHDRGGGAPEPSGGSRREHAYLNAVRLVLRDRHLTRDEERHLAALADELGIGARRAHELLVDAEREAGVA